MSKQPYWRWLLVLVLALVSPGFSARAQPGIEERVGGLLAAMTLDQRVGQMFMVSIYGPGLPETSANFLREMMPGAIAMFTSNTGTPDQVTLTINIWQAFAAQIGAHVPLLVAIDHEGGPVTRLTPRQGFTALPWGAAIGSMPVEDAQKVGAMAAEELRAVGINMNLAPVVDVRARAEKPYFVEKRTFGPDPDLVGRAATAYLQGLQQNGVVGTLKHFPGHGAAGDSHAFLPVLNHDGDQINQIELPPFEAAIKGGAEVVMVGHLSVPALDSTPGLPASLSPKIIGGVLRNQLGFTGVVMTDAMDMGAIRDNFTTPRAAVMAVQAGIDLLATGPNLPLKDQLEMKKALVEAVKRGDIGEARIEESARRVLMLKAKYGLLDWAPLEAATAAARMKAAEHQASLESLYLNTVALSYDVAELLPLKPDTKKIGLVIPGIYPAVGRECAAISPPFRAMTYSTRPTDAEIQAAQQLGRQADVVVIFTYNMGENRGQVFLVNAIPPGKAVVVALQDPYDLEKGIEPGTYMTAFNPYPPAFRAVCAVLYGRQKPVGSFQLILG